MNLVGIAFIVTQLTLAAAQSIPTTTKATTKQPKIMMRSFVEKFNNTNEGTVFCNVDKQLDQHRSSLEAQVQIIQINLSRERWWQILLFKLAEGGVTKLQKFVFSLCTREQKYLDDIRAQEFKKLRALPGEPCKQLQKCLCKLKASLDELPRRTVSETLRLLKVLPDVAQQQLLLVLLAPGGADKVYKKAANDCGTDPDVLEHMYHEFQNLDRVG